MNKKLRHALRIIWKYATLFLGAVIAAVGIDMFLVPNSTIDAGIVGISIIGSFLFPVPLVVFTSAMNLPFLVIAYQQI